MPNRAERRKQAKIKRPVYKGKTIDDIRDHWYKNGIGAKDLDDAFKDGFNQGFEQGSHGVVATCYAAFALAMRDELNLERDDIKRVLRRGDEHVCYTLSSLEIRDKVLDEIGLSLDFKEAFPEDRIQDNEDG